LEGYGLYLVTLPEQATVGSVHDFCAWMRGMFASRAESGSATGLEILATP
jgi:hypothetical protein